MKPSKHPGGRPKLPPGTQKVKVKITLDPDVVAWLDSQGYNKRSKIINSLLRQVMQKGSTRQ